MSTQTYDSYVDHYIFPSLIAMHAQNRHKSLIFFNSVYFSHQKNMFYAHFNIINGNLFFNFGQYSFIGMDKFLQFMVMVVIETLPCFS